MRKTDRTNRRQAGTIAHAVGAGALFLLGTLARQATAAGFPPLPPALLGAGPFAWPTDNRALADDLAAYHTSHADNPTLGLPGYTRGCGRTFHEGIDIAPARATASGKTVVLPVVDCATGDSVAKKLPTWDPRDSVYAVCGGRVAFVLDDPRQSNYGRYIVLDHGAPDGTAFVTLYAHLKSVAVTTGSRVAAGDRIGAMGHSSNEPTMENWLAAFPHLHFEIGHLRNPQPPKPASGVGPVGGRYNGRNIEGYDPLVFLRAALAPPRPNPDGPRPGEPSD